MLINELSTIRDYIRYATSRFNKHHISYGQGTSNAFEEANHLVLGLLYLPIEKSLKVFGDSKLLE